MSLTGMVILISTKENGRRNVHFVKRYSQIMATTKNMSRLNMRRKHPTIAMNVIEALELAGQILVMKLISLSFLSLLLRFLKTALIILSK